jgi:hypothetical protein
MIVGATILSTLSLFWLVIAVIKRRGAAGVSRRWTWYTVVVLFCYLVVQCGYPSLFDPKAERIQFWLYVGAMIFNVASTVGIFRIVGTGDLPKAVEPTGKNEK